MDYERSHQTQYGFSVLVLVYWWINGETAFVMLLYVSVAKARSQDEINNLVLLKRRYELIYGHNTPHRTDDFTGIKL